MTMSEERVAPFLERRSYMYDPLVSLDVNIVPPLNTCTHHTLNSHQDDHHRLPSVHARDNLHVTREY